MKIKELEEQEQKSVAIQSTLHAQFHAMQTTLVKLNSSKKCLKREAPDELDEQGNFKKSPASTQSIEL